LASRGAAKHSSIFQSRTAGRSAASRCQAQFSIFPDAPQGSALPGIAQQSSLFLHGYATRFMARPVLSEQSKVLCFHRCEAVRGQALLGEAKFNLFPPQGLVPRGSAKQSSNLHS
jgi:hypothetical protein